MGLNPEDIARALGAKLPDDHEWAPLLWAADERHDRVCNKCGLMAKVGKPVGVTCAEMKSDER